MKGYATKMRTLHGNLRVLYTREEGNAMLQTMLHVLYRTFYALCYNYLRTILQIHRTLRVHLRLNYIYTTAVGKGGWGMGGGQHKPEEKKETEKKKNGRGSAALTAPSVETWQA